ncbi:transposase [Scomber scombrus]|uniref:Transposase n=1 Tax=Scomber scombrus TaxID=13677 RepID=A0AAV1PPN6_SCOSC
MDIRHRDSCDPCFFLKSNSSASLSHGHQAPGCLQHLLFICPTTELRSNGNTGMPTTPAQPALVKAPGTEGCQHSALTGTFATGIPAPPLSPYRVVSAQDGTKQLDGYLACSADHMDLLKSFPAVCKLSVKLNTPLPASAACERLFSIAGLVFSPRKAKLNPRNFENQLLLKMNRHLFSFS